MVLVVHVVVLLGGCASSPRGSGAGGDGLGGSGVVLLWCRRYLHGTLCFGALRWYTFDAICVGPYALETSAGTPLTLFTWDPLLWSRSRIFKLFGPCPESCSRGIV